MKKNLNHELWKLHDTCKTRININKTDKSENSWIKKIKLIIQILFYALICFGGLFFKVKNPIISIEDKWFMTLLLLLLGITIICTNQLKKRFYGFNRIFCHFSIVVLFFCSCLTIYGILQAIFFFPSDSYLSIAGGFDNPAGYASSLCAGFPLILYLPSFYRSKWLIGSSVIAGLLVVIAVILSGSRAGMVSIAVMIVFWFLLKVKVTRKLFVSISAGITLFVLVLYFYKKDSADGRLLIWQCSWEMIKDRPMFGHGNGGFRANYMAYQANYFKQNPDSYYVMLADNINRPFNEYILLLVNYGIAGFIGFTVFVTFLLRSYCRNTCHQSKAALNCLVGIGIFSCFSYPLFYPFVWIILLFCIFTLISSANYPIITSFNTKKIVCLVTICLSLAGIVIVANEINLYISWGKTVKKSLIEQTDDTLAQYENLLPKLRNNYLFLYNYATELNSRGYYSRSQYIAEKCSKLSSDYDLQILMGINSVKLEQYEQANMYFQQAAYMCPVRFIPLNELMKIYQLKDDNQKAAEIAKKIIDKPVKVPSGKIKQIKEEAKAYLKSLMLIQEN